MPRMISEQEKLQKRGAARRQQKINTLTSRGYRADDAKEVVDSLEGARLLGRAADLAQMVGASQSIIDGAVTGATKLVERAIDVSEPYRKKAASNHEAIMSVIRKPWRRV